MKIEENVSIVLNELEIKSILAQALSLNLDDYTITGFNSGDISIKLTRKNIIDTTPINELHKSNGVFKISDLGLHYKEDLLESIESAKEKAKVFRPNITDI